MRAVVQHYHTSFGPEYLAWTQEISCAVLPSPGDKICLEIIGPEDSLEVRWVRVRHTIHFFQGQYVLNPVDYRIITETIP